MRNNQSRTKSTANNITASIISQIVNQIMTFIVRTVFIKVLSAEYLGVNGLFSNILQVLSLAELGVGSAMVYSMYKPMAESDTEKLKSYMQLYKKLYRIIGTVVIVAGIAITPFLDFFVSERPDYINLELVYILYVIRTGSSYFFAYKQSIFRADQRVYVITSSTSVFTIIRSVFEIAFLLLTKNFIVYLAITVVTNTGLNIYLAYKANKEYPYLREKNIVELPKQATSSLYKNIRAMFLNKISSVILSSTDNIIISKFIGLYTVGIYSNYSMILTVIKNTFFLIFDGFTPSIGNLCAEGSSKEKRYSVFKTIMLLNSWISGFCATSLFVLYNPFIELWIGESYLLDMVTVATIVIAFYIQTTMTAISSFRSATGLFYNDRYYSVAQAIINIILSIILAKLFGISGIFMGTSIAMLTTLFWKQACLVYKEVFNKPVIKYFGLYLKYLIVTLIGLVLTELIGSLVNVNLIVSFIFKCFCCLVVYNLVFIFAFYRTDEFKDALNRLKPILNRLRKIKN